MWNCCPIVELGSESAVLHTPDLAIAHANGGNYNRLAISR